ncbi:MAG TPA: MqnA/MqnD/SBP family protein [Rubricoccaceae bacterium]
MRLAVWPGAASAALADALMASGVVTETTVVEPHEARALLDAEGADLVLLPTLNVLRAPDEIVVVPGVALAGERSDRRALVVAAPLDAVHTVAFDPRDQQEALLAQLLLREHYGGKPVFALGAPGAGLDEWLQDADAALVPLDVARDAEAAGAIVLELGQEFVDLTIRPMPWGLVAARVGTLAPQHAAALADAARLADPNDERLALDGVAAFQLTLDGYAADGLEQLAELWFQTGTLTDIADVPFAPTLVPKETDEDEEPEED